ISRQDMMVLTANALGKLKEMQAVEDTNVLDRFNDKADIAGYAAKSMATLVTEGLISGQGDKLNPGLRATRAEAAVFLYKICNKN
ncbi:MAG: S-layer homology domain-containing protein, partial [Syntrophomonadaceae bacterium]|nr:S-layer homology domain-containing protein [Syntrophomonadaceae bacterium]